MDYQSGARLAGILSLLRHVRELLPPDMPAPMCECILLQALSQDQRGGREGSRISGLSVQTHMASSAVSRMLSSFEQRGLIVRHTDAGDRRAVYICLTQEGERRMETLNRFLYAHLDETARRFGEERMDALEGLLRGLISSIPKEAAGRGEPSLPEERAGMGPAGKACGKGE